MLKEINSVFSFLTIFPTGNADLQTIAKYMYLFPIAGIAIGFIVASFGFGLSYLGLEPLVVGLLVMGAIALITGIHHTDGLADFADGIMKKGTQKQKLQAMKDLSTGSAGIVTIVLYIVGMIIALTLIEGYLLFQAILVSEIMAKFSMVLMASVGKSAALGSNSPFLQLMKNKKKLALSIVLTVIPMTIIAGNTGMIVFAAGTIITLFLVGISTRSFGGITGDVLGATNEITRLSSLLIVVTI